MKKNTNKASTLPQFSSSSSEEDINNSLDKIKILALHGKGGSGLEFQCTLSPFLNALQKQYNEVDVDYLTAPFDGGQWWTLPPGVRSFNADKYEGFEISSQLVQEALANTKYDFILGHSQGAILLSALIAQSKDGSFLSNGTGKDAPVDIILNGAAWPNPFTELLESVEVTEEASFRCLFVIGEKDKINPPEGAKRIRESMKKGGIQVSTICHSGGHSVPVKNEEDLQRIIEWMQDGTICLDRNSC